jgi:hypothetical protein
MSRKCCKCEKPATHVVTWDEYYYGDGGRIVVYKIADLKMIGESREEEHFVERIEAGAEFPTDGGIGWFCEDHIPSDPDLIRADR